MEETKGMTLFVTERFLSLQGEGIYTGAPSYFIRTGGCNLACWFCDTSYASWRLEEQAERISVEALAQEVADQDYCRHIVITGGEPSIQKMSVSAFIKSIRKLGEKLGRQFVITMETNGTKFIPNLGLDLVSISPKLYSSTQFPGDAPSDWMQKPIPPDALINIAKWLMVPKLQSQLKFVITEAVMADLAEVGDYAERIAELIFSMHPQISVESALELIVNPRIMLMPESTTHDTLIKHSPVVEEWCKKLGYRFCDRLHLRLYDGKRGK